MSIAAQKSTSREKTHFYCSSGGNAGLACATSARSLKLPATIVIPTLTSPLMRSRLLALGVQVHQTGDNWAEADRFLREELLAKDPHGIYVSPFDHPDIWAGASTIVSEVREQVDSQIDAIVCSVGGGGLLNGIMLGVEDAEWDSRGGRPQVVAVETTGADSLNASVLAGSHVTLPAMTSIAISLGSTRVSSKTWDLARTKSDILRSLVVSDADAAISCVRFADDARQVVEPACGATLAVAYRGDLRRQLGAELSDEEWSRKTVVLVVCGGSGITLDLLSHYRETYRSQSSIQLESW